jgi:ribose-phosphate pyrophosphokinase
MSLFAPQSSALLGGAIATLLGTELSHCEEREHEGGEHKMRPCEDVRALNVFVIDSLNGDDRLSANDKLCRMLFFIGALKDAGAASVTACIPYLCYARKDRRTQPYDPVTTRYVAAMFEVLGTDRVIVLDVHNEAAFDNAFRCNAVRIEGHDVFMPHVTKLMDWSRCVVASPDIGGVKRAQQLQEALKAELGRDIGFAFMEKRRTSGAITGDALIGEVSGAEVLIYDDMIVSGGTILKATRTARAAGAGRVVVAATHAAFTQDASKLFAADGPDLVLVSDSVSLPQEIRDQFAPKLRVCSSAPALAKTIRALGKR